ncbi:hypothetical protein [Pseudaestuariivita atlantica]|uniref:Uncharacterized protein n=1 Tax=Pseudaestuariivita atlantica TaxID=1317121 RepID=A0A0L1JRY5_9RHOB|nr:hypothetical protein [Pseudaestuariivita atlantica]KNG94510.1 hypothetical protein ATO11_03565 [Pseudaestuariivita atlantica]
MLAASLAWATPGFANADLWAYMIGVCVDAVETGRVVDAAFDARERTPWQCRVDGARQPCGGTEARFGSLTGLSLVALDPMVRPVAGRGVACRMGNRVAIAGNGDLGRALRAKTEARLQGRLERRVEDQGGAWDVWRGCAWDGREYRLSAMTQATFATFLVHLGAEDRSCAPQVSGLGSGTASEEPRVVTGDGGGVNA